jgi:hypothetical protein
LQPPRKHVLLTDFAGFHACSYLHGRFAVNELSERVHGPATWQHSSDSIALHHYVLKSRDEWQVRQSGVFYRL